MDFEARDIYVLPGSDLKLEAEGTDLLTFSTTRKYSGSEADINNYIADSHRAQSDSRMWSDISVYQVPEAQFLSHLTRYAAIRDSVRTFWISMMPRDRQTSAVIRDFIFTDSVNAAYHKTGYLFSYQWFIEHDKRQDFLKRLIQPYAIQKEDPRFMASPEYRWFWNKYLIVRSERPQTGPAWMQFWFHLPELMEKNLSGKTKQIAAGIIMESLTHQYNVMNDSLDTSMNKTFNYLQQIISDPEAVSANQNRLEQALTYRRISRRGEPAPDFELLDTSGKKYTLTDFKGKVVYLDIWASWCKPCIEQFPAAQKLGEKYKDEDRLIFLTVSVDNKREAWLKGLKDHKPEGIQLWAEGGYASSFTKRYGSLGVPQYVVIDRNGKIINFKAPRPDDEPAISNLLNGMLARQSND